MKSAIKIRRAINRLLGLEYYVAGNGLEEMLVIFPDRIYSIDVLITSGSEWAADRNSIRKVEESGEAKKFVGPDTKDYILSILLARYPKIKVIE